MAIVFASQRLVALIATPLAVGLFALSPPVFDRPWTVVTSIYAHADPGHLLGNAVVVLVAGLLVERVTTTTRFHTFVITTGVLAGIAEAFVGSAMGTPPAVLGISGAALALVGYVLAGNPVAQTTLGWLELGRRGQVIVMVVLAAAVTIATAGEGVALVAHFVGFALGLFAGRLRLLHVRGGEAQSSNEYAG